MTIKAPMMSSRLSRLVIWKSLLDFSHTFTPTLGQLESENWRGTKNRDAGKPYVKKKPSLRSKLPFIFNLSRWAARRAIGVGVKHACFCRVLNFWRACSAAPSLPLFFPLWSESLLADLCSAKASLYQLSTSINWALGEGASNILGVVVLPLLSLHTRGERDRESSCWR